MTWALPVVVHPPKSRCFTIQVPDDREYVAAFRGALLELASGYNWADDTAHTAREVALVWRGVIEQVDRCAAPDTSKTPGITLEDIMSTQIRISPDDSCIIQMWCIDHWEDWYDPRECIATGAGQGRSHDGGQPEPGSSQQYCQTIEAVNPYLYPVQVNAGDVITASGFGGTWTDGVGGLLSTWRCGDGSVYALGVCTGTGKITSGTDFLPTADHMTLLAYIDGNYYELADGVPFTVPNGVVNENMLLVPNTADQSIARGSISTCVTIEAVGQLPVTVTMSLGTGPTQVTDGGIYIFSSDAGGNPQIQVHFSQSVKITIVTDTLGFPTCGAPCQYWEYVHPAGTNVAAYTYPPTTVSMIPPQPLVDDWHVAAGGRGPTFTITAKIEF